MTPHQRAVYEEHQRRRMERARSTELCARIAELPNIVAIKYNNDRSVLKRLTELAGDKIHISSAAYEHIVNKSNFDITERGNINVKGKGMMQVCSIMVFSPYAWLGVTVDQGQR